MSIAKRNLLISLKSQNCCICNEKYPWYCMDFDHIEGTKVGNVGKLPLSKFYDEIKKCRVICSNCHRIETYRKKQYASINSGRPKKLVNNLLLNVLFKTKLSVREKSKLYNQLEDLSISHTQIARLMKL